MNDSFTIAIIIILRIVTIVNIMKLSLMWVKQSDKTTHDHKIYYHWPSGILWDTPMIYVCMCIYIYIHVCVRVSIFDSVSNLPDLVSCGAWLSNTKWTWLDEFITCLLIYKKKRNQGVNPMIPNQSSVATTSNKFPGKYGVIIHQIEKGWLIFEVIHLEGAWYIALIT